MTHVQVLQLAGLTQSQIIRQGHCVPEAFLYYLYNLLYCKGLSDI